ncbi:nuclear transport factor 2 family protein [Rhizobium helianthi]|uniref:Nuclear transport factor 2 family protein n=1 Tax=Rhizobium helianthi TaxID=1132695 RepID=A0ABW4M0V6_9HYPH
MAELAHTFVEALKRLEAERDVDGISGLFAAAAEISNPLVQHRHGEANGAKRFWSQYRDSFDAIASDFRTVKEADGTSFLEWTSTGSMNGQDFTYGGVSVLEHDGEKITAFRTYFDTRHLPVAHASGGAGTGRVQISGKSNGGTSSDTEQQLADTPADSNSDLDRAQREAAEQRASGGYN